MNPLRKKLSSIELFPTVLLLGSFIAGVYFYTKFPNSVASHWGISGEVNGYSSKLVGAFGIPIMNLGMYVLFHLLPNLDPKKDRYEEFKDAYTLIRNAILLVLVVLFIAMGLYNLGYPVQIAKITPLIIGILMIVLGNYMGKIKQNYFMGIRTPWTLHSTTVWNKTHRVGGYLFVLMGSISIVTAFISPSLAFPIFMGSIIIGTAGIYIYSYLVYKKETKEIV